MSEAEGRELDAEIFRKVFGKECYIGDPNRQEGTMGFLIHQTPTLYYFNPGIKGEAAWRVIGYSRYITAAWEVVEKMYELGYSYSLRGIPASHDHQCYFAPQDRLTATAVRAATAPLAICRAALAALEEASGH